jgi:hypothetical protein
MERETVACMMERRPQGLLQRQATSLEFNEYNNVS